MHKAITSSEFHTRVKTENTYTLEKPQNKMKFGAQIYKQEFIKIMTHDCTKILPK